MHHHRVSVSKAFFSAVLCLAMITASIIVFSSCTVRGEPQAVNTPEQTEKDDDKEKEVEPAGSTEIVNKAIELAWPYGTPKEVYKYEGGSPTEEFKSALDAAYPDRSDWGKKPKAGASCDVFVGTVVRSAGFDESFPRGLDDVEAHIDKYPDLWEKHSYDDPSGFELLPGDVIFQKWSTNGRSYGHIMIYIGDGKVANAHYGGGGQYGIIQLLSKQVRNNTEIRTLKKSYVFRPVRKKENG